MEEESGRDVRWCVTVIEVSAGRERERGVGLQRGGATIYGGGGGEGKIAVVGVSLKNKKRMRVKIYSLY